MTSEPAPPVQVALPVQVAVTVWAHLPVLLAANALLLLAAVPSVAVGLGGGYLFAPLLAAVAVGPVWAGAVASADRMVRGDAVPLRVLATDLRAYAGRGLRLGLVAGAAGTATTGALAVLDADPRQRWLLIPLVADVSVLVLLLVAGFSAFSLTTTGGLRGWTLLRASLELAAAHRAATAGTLGLIVLAGLLVGWVPGTLAALPAPLAVYLSAWTFAAIRQQHETV